MVILQLAKKSLARRKSKALVAMLGLSISVSLLLVLLHIKNSLHHTIERATKQSDLIIGAPSQPAHLALYGLFRIGNPPPTISIKVYQFLKGHSEVSSAIPVSVMESHKGFSVTGTTNDLFQYFDPYQPLKFSEGKGFDQPKSVVLGARIASKTGYRLGEWITIASGANPFLEDEYSQPLTISGILEPTGTVLDNTILVNLNDLKQLRKAHQPETLETENINLILVRLHNRQALLPMELQMKHQAPQPVEVVIPNQELNFLQGVSNQFTSLMIAIVTLTAAMALVSVFFSVSSSLAERRYEIDTLRMLGARFYQVIAVGLLEPMMIIVTATITGFILFKALVIGLEALLFKELPGEWQVWIADYPASFSDVKLLLLVILAGSLLAAIAAWKTYGQCLRGR